jgi:hypothetical protein
VNRTTRGREPGGPPRASGGRGGARGGSERRERRGRRSRPRPGTLSPPGPINVQGNIDTRPAGSRGRSRARPLARRLRPWNRSDLVVTGVPDGKRSSKAGPREDRPAPRVARPALARTWWTRSGMTRQTCCRRSDTLSRSEPSGAVGTSASRSLRTAEPPANRGRGATPALPRPL